MDCMARWLALYTHSNVDLGKFWPDLEILEAFEMGLEVSCLE